MTCENTDNLLSDNEFKLPMSLNPLANVANVATKIMGLIKIEEATIIFHFSKETGVLHTIDPFSQIKSVLNNEKIAKLVQQLNAWHQKAFSSSIKIKLKKLKLKKVTAKADKMCTKLFIITCLIRYKNLDLLKSLEIDKCHISVLKNFITTQCEQRSILPDYFSFTV